MFVEVFGMKTAVAARLHYHPAVDRQYLAGNVACRRANEKAYSTGNIIRLTQHAQRDLPLYRVDLVFAQSARHVGTYEAGCDRVATHTAGRQFLGHALGQTTIPAFEAA